MRDKVEIDSEALAALRRYAPGYEDASQEWCEVLRKVDEALRIANLPLYEFHGLRWWNARDGWTLTSARLYRDGELVWQGRGTGYGDQYIQMCMGFMKRQGWVPEDAPASTLYVREELHSTYDVRDVEKKNQLHPLSEGVPLETGL